MIGSASGFKAPRFEFTHVEGSNPSPSPSIYLLNFTLMDMIILSNGLQKNFIITGNSANFRRLMLTRIVAITSRIYVPRCNDWYVASFFFGTGKFIGFEDSWVACNVGSEMYCTSTIHGCGIFPLYWLEINWLEICGYGWCSCVNLLSGCYY